MYHFLSGYTSKLAGTERGVTSPQTTFSTCFGSPFLPLPAHVYAEMLGHKIDEHGVQVFLVNTGWTGGGYGVGERMKLSYTRAMVKAAIEGRLNQTDMTADSIFGLRSPVHVPGVPDEVLQPENTWSDKQAYNEKALFLANEFKENFKSFPMRTRLPKPADLSCNQKPRAFMPLAFVFQFVEWSDVSLYVMLVRPFAHSSFWTSPVPDFSPVFVLRTSIGISRG